MHARPRTCRQRQCRALGTNGNFGIVFGPFLAHFTHLSACGFLQVFNLLWVMGFWMIALRHLLFLSCVFPSFPWQKIWAHQLCCCGSSRSRSRISYRTSIGANSRRVTSLIPSPWLLHLQVTISTTGLNWFSCLELALHYRAFAKC